MLASREPERPLRILYHHRTQAEDAQGIHVHEIIRNFKTQGHAVREIALVPAEDGPHTSARDKPTGGGWALVSRAVPNFGYELMEMAYNAVGYFKLIRAIRDFRPDFIYERYSLHTACGIWAARRYHLPLLLEVNAPLALEQEKAGKLAFRRLARWSERWIVSHAARAIAVSTPMKEIFVNMGVPAEQIEVIGNGVDPDHFHGRDTSAQVRARYGLQNRRVLGFVGWIRRWHGLVELAEAMGGWETDMRDVHLLIVGDGPARAAVEAAAAEAGVADRVHITGAIGRADVPDHIAAFDLALQPAATSYASPMKVFEYMAMGKPVLACRQPNLQEILSEGETGLFFTSGDFAELARTARELLSDRPRLERMGRVARDSIGQRGHLWSRNAARAVEIARTLLG